MDSMNFMRKNRLVEWNTIMDIVRKEVEPREYNGDINGAKQILEQLPQEDGIVLKKWADVLFKEAQMNKDMDTAKEALAKALSAEAIFPHAKYKHNARQLQIKIKQWLEQNSTSS
jgi:hypothetical protein